VRKRARADEGIESDRDPIVELRSTIAAASGLTTIDSIDGTCDANVAEYWNAGMNNCSGVPRNANGIISASAVSSPPRAISRVLIVLTLCPCL
jgi:hypothetical protein